MADALLIELSPNIWLGEMDLHHQPSAPYEVTPIYAITKLNISYTEPSALTSSSAGNRVDFKALLGP